MRLHSLHLQNIRSYVNEKVDFAPGMTLLAGDIGSGKTTILLALEFALFGIQRGETSGAALLRHGTQQGKVTLAFSLSKQKIEITRSLKRNNTRVGQESGSITIDGVEQTATAQELKAKVLELLNYPPSLLTTGKRPLFRYTVYTPQEEMKAIIYEKADERLDTLRKLFDIDKYRRIRENCLNLIRELRKEETDLKARIEELSKELVDEKEHVKAQEETAKALQEATKRHTEAQEALKKAEAAFEALEKNRFKIEEVKKQLAISSARSEELKRREKELATEQEEQQLQVDEIEKHLTPADTDEEELLKKERILKEHELRIKEKEKALLEKAATHHSRVENATRMIAKITELDECPTCQQEVRASHKEHITQEQEGLIAKAKEALAHLESLKPELAKRQQQVDEKRQELLQKRQFIAANKEKQKRLEQTKRRIDALAKAVQETGTKLQQEQERQKGLAQQLKEKEPIDEERHQEEKNRVGKARQAAQQSAIALAELKKEREGLEKETTRLKKRKEERVAYGTRLKQVTERLTWLNKHFLNVTYAIEKALFTNLHGLFNEYFKEWFATLLEDETLHVRLDSDFTPIISQDGYETSIEHLSGGEKTSIALAYRLSLNKVINEFLSSIKTSDLLILDEPTDGFSSEQLDRVREVLDQLKLEQVLIVSHETQMEGYVDHIIRVNKAGHESKVSA